MPRPAPPRCVKPQPPSVDDAWRLAGDGTTAHLFQVGATTSICGARPATAASKRRSTLISADWFRDGRDPASRNCPDCRRLWESLWGAAT